DAGIDNGKMDSLRHERQRVRKRQGALENGLGRDAVRDVDDLDVGRDPFDHAVTGADEVVLHAEVSQECDESRHAAAESTRPSAPGKRARPTGCGNSASKPSCEESVGTKSTPIPCSARAAAVASPTAATLGRRPEWRRPSSAAPFVLVTMTQS